MDTVSSLPIRWLENLISVLVRWKRSGSIRDKEDLVERVQSILNQMKYSYLEPEEIVKSYVPDLVAALERIIALPMPERQRIFTSYVLEEVKDLERKFRVNPTEPFQVFRYRFVEIESVSKHPTLPNLRICVVRDLKGEERRIVTNVTDVKTGDHALIVMLPPRDFDGVWSEGMFVQFGVTRPEDVDMEKLKSLNSHFNVSF